ncbi:MAG: hypothetical protein AAFU85_25725 [Planctomycetota bacterium]
MRTLEGFETWILDLAWSGDAKWLAGCTFEEELMVVDAVTGQIVVDRPDIRATSVDWHQTEPRLAVGELDGSLRLLDPSGKEAWNVRRETERIWAVRFGPDGSQLATAENGAIIIWDTQTGEQVSMLNELRENYKSIDWSPDGKRLVSASDSSVVVWDVDSRQVAIKLASGSVRTVRWSPDGMSVLAGSWGEGVHLWDATRGYEEERRRGLSSSKRNQP